MKYLALSLLILIPHISCAQSTKGNASLVLISSASEPFDKPQNVSNKQNISRYHLTLSHKKYTSKKSESTIPISSFKNLSPHQKSVLHSIHITAEY